MLWELCSCYSLFLGFARSVVNFHAEDGSGYKFLGDSILKARILRDFSATRRVCFMFLMFLCACSSQEAQAHRMLLHVVNHCVHVILSHMQAMARAGRKLLKSACIHAQVFQPHKT